MVTELIPVVGSQSASDVSHKPSLAAATTPTQQRVELVGSQHPEARDSEWQWHQLGRMQVCTLLQTDNHASTPPLSFYRPDALPAAQPTASKH